jgi:8-oxo-dGTP pyrophosphatase MutT (NUDIX family)
VFEQKKYGIEGSRYVRVCVCLYTSGEQERASIHIHVFILIHTHIYMHAHSLAPIGGLIEPGEEPLEAAKRELMEEAGLGMYASLWAYMCVCEGKSELLIE